MKKYTLAIVAFSAFTMTAATCSAQEVVFTGGEAPIPVYQSLSAAVEDQPEVMNVERLNVLGVVDGLVAVEVPATPAADDEITGEVDAEGTTEATETTIEVTEPTEPIAEEGEGKVSFALLQDILTIIPSLDYASLPTVDEWTDHGQGATGDVVASAQ